MRDSSKVSVFCANSRKKVYGPFFFDGNVNGDVELTANEHGDFIFQQDGLHLTGSSLCVHTTMKICEGQRSGVVVMETICC